MVVKMKKNKDYENKQEKFNDDVNDDLLFNNSF